MADSCPLPSPCPLHASFPPPPLPSCSLNVDVPWVPVLSPPWVISSAPPASSGSGMLIICSLDFQPICLLISKLQLLPRELDVPLNVLPALHSSCALIQRVSHKCLMWASGVSPALYHRQWLAPTAQWQTLEKPSGHRVQSSLHICPPLALPFAFCRIFRRFHS